MTKVSQEHIEDVAFSDTLSQRYLAYALSTIMSRSLPDVRDGLKPVHRRLLYAMRLLKLDPSAGYKKCARVVGDVIGKYHPHGDQSVYDALVRLAQDFSVRYPLVDGQGNFGNIDGDNPAAMRYTEARLTEFSRVLMDGLDEEAVDFRATYDGEEEEPMVFPGAFPNLLANGAAGIAVGMATSVPPHNLGELIAALKLLLKRPDAEEDEILALIPGPDFPTGGILVEPPSAIRDAYRSGRGGFRLRARWHKEDTGRGTYQIVVSEIPYQVAKSRLIEKIAELINDKKVPILADVRDESSDELRLVLEPRSKNVEAEILMESLFRVTDLETRFPLNLNVLDKTRTPMVMSLHQALQAFIEHQIEVLERRSRFRLGEIAHRLEILGGYLIAYLNLDEVIRIIREEDEPKQELIRVFSLSDVQAEAILNMRLRSLRRLEEMQIRKEDAGLRAEQAELDALLADRMRQRARIAARLDALDRAYGPDSALGRRRTGFAEAPHAELVPIEAMIDKEPITALLSAKGWIRALKGHVSDAGDIKYKEGDEGRFLVHAQTTDKLLLLSSDGRFYTLGCDKLPGGRGHGEPVRLMIDLDQAAEIVAVLVHAPGGKLLLVSRDGRGFIAHADELLAQKRAGKQVMKVADGSAAFAALPTNGDHVALVGDNRRLLVFPLADIPEMARGQGVALQRFKDGGLADIAVIPLAEGLSWPMGGATGRTRTETDLSLWLGKRAQAGRPVPGGFPRSGRFSG